MIFSLDSVHDRMKDVQLNVQKKKIETSANYNEEPVRKLFTDLHKDFKKPTKSTLVYAVFFSIK